MRIAVIPPKVPSRGYSSSSYREDKIVAHRTRQGRGLVAQARLRDRKKKDG